jgi:transcriptional regulator with XRE-family HTH domain
MSRVFSSPRHHALAAFLLKKRQDAGLRQVDLAKKLRRRQDYVSDIETGHKIINVVELMEWADALDFDPQEAIRFLKKN